MTTMIHHPNGKPQHPEDYEVGKMRLTTIPTCKHCQGRLEADRVRFLENRKVPKTSEAWKMCSSCSFFVSKGLPPVR